MARRATYFKAARENADTVIVSGGYEFSPFGLERDRHPSVISMLKRAYNLLGYDITLRAPNDAVAFEHAGIEAGQWVGPFDEPQLVTRKVQDGSLAFILFPDSGQHDPDIEDKTAALAESVRKDGKYNLIIGVSTWGANREQDFIDRHGAAFDIILGSGPGPGYAGLYLRDNSLLWVRAFTKGRSVLGVTIPSLPKPGGKILWEPQTTVLTTSAPLGGDVASDPEINAIFNP